MLYTSTDKYWNTWDELNNTVMEFLPLGFQIRLGAYSRAYDKSSDFRFSLERRELIRLLEHEKDGRYCHMRLEHDHAQFDVEYLKPDSWTVLCRIRNVRKQRGNGFRYHILAGFGFLGEGEMILQEDQELFGRCGDRHIAVRFLEKPFLYDKVGSFAQALTEPDGDECLCDTCKAKRAERARSWMVGRFMMESTPDMAFAVSVADSDAEAVASAQDALSRLDRFEALRDAVMAGQPRLKTALYPGALEAVNDIMAWNAIRDSHNCRVHTGFTKMWNSAGMGGWYLFTSDIGFNVLLASLSGDRVMAAENVDAALSAATHNGNLAGLLSPFQSGVDHSQPPVLSFCLLMHYYLSGDLMSLEKAYETLKTANQWWNRCRDGNGNMVLELGSTNTGHAHHHFTKMGCKEETAMDTSPLYDAAVFHPETATLDIEDVGINSQVLIDTEALAAIAALLEREEDQRFFCEKYARMSQKVAATLWDDQRHIFANRFWNGSFGNLSPTSFYALAAGIASEEQVDDCIRHIFDPAEFWTPYPMPAISAQDPSINDNCYWRGRTWAPQCFWTYLGLRRYHRDQEARRLAEGVLRCFDKNWTEHRWSCENYNPFTGEGEDVTDSDPFYAWTALLPALWVMEYLSVDMRDGLCFGTWQDEDFSLENFPLRGGRLDLCRAAGITQLRRSGGEALFRSNLLCRFRGFRREAHYACVRVAAPRDGWVEFPGSLPFRVLVDGESRPAAIRLELPAGKETLVELFF